jgi:hypothetical protein
MGWLGSGLFSGVVEGKGSRRYRQIAHAWKVLLNLVPAWHHKAEKRVERLTMIKITR